MISALSKGVLQLRDPSTIKMVWMCFGIVIFQFLILFVLTDIALRYTSFFQVSWLETITDTLGRVVTLMLTWLLFPAAISSVISFFLNRVASAVEERYYPSLPPIAASPIVDSIFVAIKFLIVLISLNILLLFFIFTGPIYIILYYLVNGYLIGREFFELIASRRLDVGEIRMMRKQFRLSLIIIGGFFAFLMTVPIVNLLMPIIATTTMVHLFENWRAKNTSVLTKSNLA